LSEESGPYNAAVFCANPTCRAVEVIEDAPGRLTHINRLLSRRGWFTWVEMAWCPKHGHFFQRLKARRRYMDLEYEIMDAREQLERVRGQKEKWANDALDAFEESDE